jgi:hypothetical protein
VQKSSIDFQFPIIRVPVGRMNIIIYAWRAISPALFFPFGSYLSDFSREVEKLSELVGKRLMCSAAKTENDK